MQFASSGEPADQGVSLLGVTFGMKKSDVRTMLGKPMYDNGDSFEWEVTVSDAGYKGSFTIYFTDDADNGTEKVVFAVGNNGMPVLK